MHTRLSLTLLITLLAVDARAQGSANPLTESTRRMYGPLRDYLVATADRIPDAAFDFRPTPDVRTVAQLLAHIANAEFTICAASLGESNPHPDNLEARAWTPAELRRVVRESFALCDRAYAALTDANLSGEIAFFGGSTSRHYGMTYNLVHANEHYGNLVTYMRLKGIVPPSSAPR